MLRFVTLHFLAVLSAGVAAVSQNSLAGTAVGHKNNNPTSSDIYTPIAAQDPPVFNTLGDICLQIGYPCDTYGSICASQKAHFPQTRKIETSGRCRCRPGFFEVESACSE